MSDMITLVKATLTEATNNANALADKIGAATTDRSKRVHEILSDSTTEDENVKKFQEWEEKLLASLEEQREKVAAYVTEKYLTEVSEEEVTALKEQYKAAKEQVVTARKFAATIPGFTDETLKDVPELKNLRGGSTGSGSGGKRTRVERIGISTDDGKTYTDIHETVKDAKTGEDVDKANFTIAAKWLSKDAKSKVEVKDLQAAAFEAAKTDDLSSLNGKIFDFAYSVGDKRYFVKVQPAVKGSESEDEATTETATE